MRALGLALLALAAVAFASETLWVGVTIYAYLNSTPTATSGSPYPLAAGIYLTPNANGTLWTWEGKEMLAYFELNNVTANYVASWPRDAYCWGPYLSVWIKVPADKPAVTNSAFYVAAHSLYLPGLTITNTPIYAINTTVAAGLAHVYDFGIGTVYCQIPALNFTGYLAVIGAHDSSLYTLATQGYVTTCRIPTLTPQQKVELGCLPKPIVWTEHPSPYITVTYAKYSNNTFYNTVGLMAKPYNGFAHMLGVVVINDTVYFLVDGKPMWRLDFNETPVLYLGPLEYAFYMDNMMPGAGIGGFVPPFYLASGTARVWLFLGNESPPSPEGPYGPLFVPPAVAATTTWFYATNKFDGYSLSLVGPPPQICTSEFTCKWAIPDATMNPYLALVVWDHYGVRIPVYINGTLSYEPYGFVLNGDWIAYGDVVQTPAGPMAVGPAWFWPSRLPVSIELPNGSAVTVEAPIFKPLNYTPPQYVYFGNGTRLAGPKPIYIANVTRPVEVEAEYSYRQYLVVINAPGNITEGWLDAGSTIFVDERPVVDFGNGTRLVEPRLDESPLPLALAVDRPLNATVSYTRQYYVVIRAPGNTTAGWYNAGSVLYVQPAIYFGNGTRLANPSPAHVAVTKPLNVTVEYTKQYYVVINAPGNVTAGWFDAGSTLYIQPVVYLGNSTRLVRPTPAKVLVTKPLNVTVSYVKQYYVEVRAFNNATAGWFDAGSVVVVEAPAFVYFGNGTRLALVGWSNGRAGNFTAVVDGPASLSAQYQRQYLVVVRGLLNSSMLWMPEGSTLRLNAVVVNGVLYEPLAYIGDEPVGAAVAVDKPLNVTVVYNASAVVKAGWLLPALYASARMSCGGESTTASGWLASRLELNIYAPAALCEAGLAQEVPTEPLAATAIAAAAAAIWRRSRRR